MRWLALASFVYMSACGAIDTPTPYDPNPASNKQSPPAQSGPSSSSSSGGTSATTTGGSSEAGTTSSSTSTSSSGGGSSSTGGAPSFNPKTWVPPSQGLWIWRFDDLDMTADQAAQKAASLGIAWVLIKSGQDDYWNTRYTPDVVESFTSRGIHVFAWPYITPDSPADSIAGAVAAAQVPGTSGLVLDVEIEFQGTSAGEYAPEAEEICQGIRSQLPDVFLAYTSFGWVDDHDTFPYATFDKYCGDAFFPQVYWSDFGVTPQDGYTHAEQALAATHLQAPVWMVQSNDSGENGVPTPAELNVFSQLSGPRTSLWSLTDTTTTQYEDLQGVAWNSAGGVNENVARQTPALSTAPPEGIDLSSAEAVFAGQLHLLQTHVIDDAAVSAFQQTIAVSISKSDLQKCQARVIGNKITPDWPMAKRDSARVRVSVFGKSLTSFSKAFSKSQSVYHADSLWCR